MKSARWKWQRWPQALARNVAVNLRGVGHGGPGRLDRFMLAAKTLADQTDAPLAGIVVFYPRKMHENLLRQLRRHRARGDLKKYRGLVTCPVKDMGTANTCVAFRIRDVEAHKTPADAYIVSTHVPLKPKPLYTKRESNLGREIHE